MGGCLFLWVLVCSQALQVISGESSPLKCNQGSKLCRDGAECVPYSHMCDGEVDCGDGSDEEDCESACSADQFQCAHGRMCIAEDQVCDGVPQCQDRSDEVHCLKESDECVHHCDSGRICLPLSFLCDGETDCMDGTDEANCEDLEEGTNSTSTADPTAVQSRPIKCLLGSKPCRDNRECVRYSHVCDGEADCKDGSDEDECAIQCEKGQFQCAHGKKCIAQSQVCDGKPQCQDRSDELECVKVVDGCAQCDEKTRCIPKNFLCDGERDCRDGSDEANCVEEACTAAEFRCTSSQCVSAKLTCDGHPDCWDGSDEESCTKVPVCTTKHRCPRSKECLVQEWICDGDQDCKDGTDEKDCPATPATCEVFQWMCKSKTKCIPVTWKCDGMADCEDGSDEAECEVKKCLPHQYQCNSQDCLDPSLVCNGIPNCPDSSDEGGSCEKKCSEETKRCSQSCYSSPQGPICGCDTGYHLMDDGQTCDDINECEGGTPPGVCSQRCVNAPGSYRCDCLPGFIMEAEGRQCKVTGEPFLLVSVQTDLYLYGLRSGRLDILISSAKKIIWSLDYSWRDQKVFWVELNSSSIRWSSLDQKITGTLIRGVRADSVAVDWLGKNIYWIDGMNGQIVVARNSLKLEKSEELCIILDEDLDQPRALALFPQKGLMFWSETRGDGKIERAGMDGSERRAVVTSGLGWPGGVAVDTISERVYWTDEKLKAIGSTMLDGSNVQILQMKETTNPFSVAVFNDLLYWSDAKKRVVQSAQKFTGKKRRVLLKRPKQPFAIKIIHPMLQTSIKNPCAKTDCSHLCVLAPGPKPVCKCPSGLLLEEDGLTCSRLVDSAFLLLLSPSTVTQIDMKPKHAVTDLKGWPEHLALQVPGINKAAIFDYSLQDHTLFLTDDGTASLSSFKLKGSLLASRGQLLRLLGDAITTMALDWVTLNIFWSSSMQPHLQVTSSTGKHTAVLVKEAIGRVVSIALHPPSGRICFANLAAAQEEVTTATVECAYMDGTERWVVWKDGVQPTSLVLSPNGETLYWADTSLGTIGSVLMDGSSYKEVTAGKGLTAIALNDDTLLWMSVTDKTRIWFKDEQEQKKLWFEVGTKVLGLKAFTKSSQKGTNQCSKSNGDCQHLCLASSKGRNCLCAHDYVLVNSTHCSRGESCASGSRPCLSLLACHPAEKFCDGHVDCADHSDENCVGVNKPKTKLSLPNRPRSSFLPSPSPTLSEVTALTFTLNASGRVEDKEQCSQSRCGGNGRCVDVGGLQTCACLLGFSGDSCQHGFLKTMKAPLIYAAAGLMALLVAIVIAVIVQRRKARTSKSNAETKDMTLTELENKVETVNITEMAKAEKPQEAMTSTD